MILDGLERLDGKERLRLREYLLDSRILVDGRYQGEKEEREEATYLEKKNLEYVMQVLQEENGNQSRAAKRLGIGRTTLWRMLKQ